MTRARKVVAKRYVIKVACANIFDDKLIGDVFSGNEGWGKRNLVKVKAELVKNVDLGDVA